MSNKVKKPFYKRVWFWLVVVVVVGVIGGGLGGGSKSSSSNSSSSSPDKTISKNADLRKKFDAIKVGDLMSNGEGGTTLVDVEKSLGKASTTSSTDVNGVKVKDYVWTKGGVTVSVQFNDDKTVSKNITGFKFTRKPKLDLAGFNSIQDGASYDDVIKKYGEPDGLDEMLIDGKKTVTAIWLTGTKGGGTVTLTFTNDALTSKTQTKLK